MRQIFYLKSFEEKREYGIAAGGQMHSVDGDYKRKYLTLQKFARLRGTLFMAFRSSLFTAMCRDITKGSCQQRMETRATSD